MKNYIFVLCYEKIICRISAKKGPTRHAQSIKIGHSARAVLLRVKMDMAQNVFEDAFVALAMSYQDLIFSLFAIRSSHCLHLQFLGICPVTSCNYRSRVRSDSALFILRSFSFCIQTASYSNDMISKEYDLSGIISFLFLIILISQ